MDRRPGPDGPLPAHRPGHAREQASQLIAHLRECPIAELARLGRTLHSWRNELLARFEHPTVSNGPTENLNLQVKNAKRKGRGFRNFSIYRLRLLLNHGRIRDDQPVSRIRTRTPRLAA
jgi:transposase